MDPGGWQREGQPADAGSGRTGRAARQRGEQGTAHSFPGPSRDQPARVGRVTDGDTLTLVGLGSVRLIGVDTPEVFGGAECYGREASAYTKRVLRPGRPVRYRPGVEPRDRYARLLAYVWLEDDRLFNGLIVERGYAVPLTIPPNVDFAERFGLAARRARRAGVGL